MNTRLRCSWLCNLWLSRSRWQHRWGLLAAFVFCMPTFALAQDVSGSAHEEDRLMRWQQLADSLARVKFEKKSSTGDKTAAGRRLSKSSQVHMRFLIAAAELAENKIDGFCTFPVQVSGFTSEIDSSKQIDNQKTGSDLQRAEIKIVGLVGLSRPKVTIKLASLNHGSMFPVDQIARDKIHDLVRFYFPEADIEGKQRFFEKEIEIQNASKEAVRVWVYGRSWVRSPTKDSSEEVLGKVGPEGASDSKRLDWRWLPGEPDRAEPIELKLAAGEIKKVRYGDQPLAANRILVWGEGEAGDQWGKYKTEPLWTVEANASENGERTYHATKIATFTYKIEPQPGPKLLTERLLEMKNDTSEAISVDLKYRTNAGQGFVWKSVHLVVPSKTAVRPTDAAGAYIRGSRIFFKGESDTRQYLRHQSEPLWIVEETAGRRVYKSETMGVYRYTFQSAQQSASVAVDSAPVMVGTQTIATVKRNEQFEILSTKDDWIQVAVNVKGEKQVGWIKKANLQVQVEDLSLAPEASRRSLVINAADAELKQGSTTLARLKRGESYRVLEQNGFWHRIEVMVDGDLRHGWVHESKVQLSR